MSKIKETSDDRCRKLPARGTGGVPQSKEIPQDWGIRGLIITRLEYIKV